MSDKVEVAIRGLGSSGEGVGSLLSGDKYTLFVDGALPSEVVLADIFLKKKNYGKGKLLQIIKPSKERVKPVCPLFGTCGGCQIMHLSYQGQLEIKRQKVVDALTRIAKVETNVEPCLPSPTPLHYRNKIQMPVECNENSSKIGLYAKNSHDLIDVKECFIHGLVGEKVYQKLREALLKSPARFEVTNLLIKSGFFTNEVLVVFVTRKEPSKDLRAFSKKILSEIEEVKGVIHNLQEEESNVILGRRFETLAGNPAIYEKLLGLKFKVSPASFFQVNPRQAENLYQIALDFAELNGEEKVLDAFCGVGTLSLFAAKLAKSVIGVECVKEAVDDAFENANLNDIKNVEFIKDDVERYIRKSERFDVVFLNPPRQGCDPEVISSLGKMKPKRVVYISCDPATLARDLALLVEYGYKIVKVQPVDMFPETSHVETVVKLAL